MLVNIGSTSEGFKDWGIDLEVPDETTVAELKTLLAAPPHSLPVATDTKVLWKTGKGVLMSLMKSEKVKSKMVLLNVAPAMKIVSFPEKFIWGGATAAYQIEGAVAEGGRSPSIWDTFAALPGKVKNGDTGAGACDHYHRFKEDIHLLKSLGFPAYRFSISWPRLLPNGRGEPNPQAVEFYNQVIDELALCDIQAWVTLYHWDLPQCLQDEYSGWLGKRVCDDFEHYASVCFREFGDRVKNWITINEPWCACVLGYATAEHAPGRKQDPAREPYQAAHHMILAHARAVQRYRAEFRNKQHGQIGITLNMDWKEPLSESAADMAASRRALDWQLGWFADPIYKGQYPENMRKRCGDRLPTFTAVERRMVQGSADFFGLNHYSSDFVSPSDHRNEHRTPHGKDSDTYFDHQDVKNLSDPSWPKTDSGWDIVPWGFQHLLSWISKEYQPRGGIIVTENGCAVREPNVEVAKNDTERIEYLQGYLFQLHKAMSSGADVRGYFVWSFLDNFEWQSGYAKRFGIVHVDYQTQVRTPKASATFISDIIKRRSLTLPIRVMTASEFAPMGKNPPLEKPAPEKIAKENGRTEVGVVLTNSCAITLLEELLAGYVQPDFQKAIADAYRKMKEDGNEVGLVKTKRALCLPIQAAILPKYGFEPTQAGVYKLFLTMRKPELTNDVEVQKRNAMVQFITTEFPAQAQDGSETDAIVAIEQVIPSLGATLRNGSALLQQPEEEVAKASADNVAMAAPEETPSQNQPEPAATQASADIVDRTGADETASMNQPGPAANQQATADNGAEPAVDPGGKQQVVGNEAQAALDDDDLAVIFGPVRD